MHLVDTGSLSYRDHSMISLMGLARFDPIFLPYLFASADDEMAILRSGEHGRSKEGMRKEGRKEMNRRSMSKTAETRRDRGQTNSE